MSNVALPILWKHSNFDNFLEKNCSIRRKIFQMMMITKIKKKGPVHNIKVELSKPNLSKFSLNG